MVHVWSINSGERFQGHHGPLVCCFLVYYSFVYPECFSKTLFGNDGYQHVFHGPLCFSTPLKRSLFICASLLLSNALGMDKSKILSGPVFTKQSQEHSLSFSADFANLNVTQLLIG